MHGIVFFRTKNLSTIKEFYESIPNIELWLEQADCIVFKHGNLLVGFCQRENTDTQGMITFVYDSKEEVDTMKTWCNTHHVPLDSLPKENQKYRIYHFFARDPDGRAIEFQYFLDQMKPYC